MDRMDGQKSPVASGLRIARCAACAFGPSHPVNPANPVLSFLASSSRFSFQLRTFRARIRERAELDAGGRREEAKKPE